jgi:hypothetical protein
MKFRGNFNCFFPENAFKIFDKNRLLLSMSLSVFRKAARLQAPKT